jgi:hypothetical protein
MTGSELKKNQEEHQERQKAEIGLIFDKCSDEIVKMGEQMVAYIEEAHKTNK